MVLLIWHLLTSLHAFGVQGSIKSNGCEAFGELNWGNTYIRCSINVMCNRCGYASCHLQTSLHAFGVHGSIKNNRCGACGELNWRKYILDALQICMGCTIFLFSMLYKIPFFCVVQNSCFHWCTIFLFFVMYNTYSWKMAWCT